MNNESSKQNKLRQNDSERTREQKCCLRRPVAAMADTPASLNAARRRRRARAAIPGCGYSSFLHHVCQEDSDALPCILWLLCLHLGERLLLDLG